MPTSRWRSRRTSGRGWPRTDTGQQAAWRPRRPPGPARARGLGPRGSPAMSDARYLSARRRRVMPRFVADGPSRPDRDVLQTAEYELPTIAMPARLSRTDRPVLGIAPAILWLHACGEGAKRSRLSSSGGPVSQRICVPTRQTATRHAHAAGSRADHPTSPAPPPHHGYLRDPRISQQVPARILDRPRVPGASCRASTTPPKPPEASGSSSVYPGNGPLGHVCLLAVVSRRSPGC